MCFCFRGGWQCVGAFMFSSSECSELYLLMQSTLLFTHVSKLLHTVHFSIFHLYCVNSVLMNKVLPLITAS